MRQFRDLYNVDSVLAPLVRELPWSHHIIMGRCDRPEERQFYLIMTRSFGTLDET
jgi:DUF1016 N-terminal domain